ncbi:MAG: response regulator [Saprospiraceae bacterium]|nr:response regulator [Saprospiraceae bacterium]
MKKQFEILLIEDNSGDVILLKEAFKRLDNSYNITVAQDGEDAIAYLTTSIDAKTVTSPDIILLDINMPRMNGFQVLAKLRSESSYLAIPIIIFSTSLSEPDIMKCYELKANCFITKPPSFNDLIEVVKQIDQFWFKTARLPCAI